MTRARPLRPGPLVGSLLGFACLLLTGCDSNPSGEGRVSPLPYGYREPDVRARATRPAQGQELDELVAVVYGEALTRRRLIRETGGRAPGQDDAAFEADLERRRVEWAREMLLVKAAESEGLRAVASAIDEAVARAKAEKVQELSRNTGRPVTFEEYLTRQNISEEEFRTQVKHREMRLAYTQKLLVGLGRGMRPQVDYSVSPAEVRRLYREEPELFDDQPGARFAFFVVPTIEYLVDDVSPSQAEAAARARAEELAQAFRAGATPRQIAERFKLGERVWRELPELQSTFKYPEGAAWLFAPERKAGDAQAFQFAGEPAGPVVLAVLEVRAAAKHSFDEAYDDVVGAYRLSRRLRLENLKVIELAQTGSVVWPESLADQLVDQARDTLQKIDQEQRLARARFR